jgi:hypothetical protein
MAELGTIAGLIDLGLPAILLLGVIILWRQNQELLKLLLQQKEQSASERKAIATDLKELKFWSGYAGDTPPGHDAGLPYADDMRAGIKRKNAGEQGR